MRVLCYVLALLCVVLGICLYYYSQRQVLPPCVRDRPSINRNTIFAAQIRDLFLPLHSDCSFDDRCFYQGHVFTYNFRPISIQFMERKMTQ